MEARGEGGPLPLELASRGQRLAGAVIDMVFQAAVGLPLVFLLGVAPDIWNPLSLDLLEKLRLASAGWVSYLLLHGWLLHTRGQTVGKWIVGTRIVDMDGEVPPLARVMLLRLMLLGAVSTALPAQGWALSLFNVLLVFRADRRCLHDHIAGTRVVHV
jgi:uncharacterized RDD family membrane protein YckC